MGLFHTSSWTGFEPIGTKYPFLRDLDGSVEICTRKTFEWSGKGLEEGFENETLRPVWRNERILAKAVL